MNQPYPVDKVLGGEKVSYQDVQGHLVQVYPASSEVCAVGEEGGATLTLLSAHGEPVQLNNRLVPRQSATQAAQKDKSR